MRIGIVTTWFERGAAYVSKQFVEVLQEEHDVFVYARGGEEYAIGDDEWDKGYVYWGKRYLMPVDKTYVDAKDFTLWLDSNRLDLVLFNEQRWWQPIKICKQKGVKTGAYIDYYTDSVMPLFELYDFLICNTKRHFSAFSWHKQAYYVPWGTDINVFKPKDNNVKEKADKNLVFFHSAGMSPFRKGTDFVIKAFDILSRTDLKSKLIIHTQINLTDFFPDLSDVISTLINRGRLEIIEKTVSAPGLYHLGDVYVYPSRIEGIGLTIVEALACGLPVITVDNGPMNEFIFPPSAVVEVKRFYCRSDGYYWPVCEVNLELLVSKMKEFVGKKSQVKEFKKTSREQAVNKFNWSDNKLLINKLFKNAKIIPAKKDLFIEVDKKDTYKYPMILKYPRFYSIIYSLMKKIKNKSINKL